MAISVVINTYNAAKQLERTLESVTDFDEIVVCDMESTDHTLDIARGYGCKIVTFERKDYNIVEHARNFAISQASNEWVLVVDADEVVTSEMRKYLYAQTAQETTPDGIFLPRRNYFMGQFMHALYPDYQLRFFRKSQVCWPAIIHTQPKVDGRLVHAPKNGMVAFEHYQDDSIKARLQKTDIYTDNECPKRKARHFGTSSLVFRPIHRFLKAYLLKGGFRDGLPGFIFACLEAYYQLIMVAKLCEQQKQLKVEEPTSKVSKIIVISKFTTQNAQTVSINHVALP